MAMTTRQHGDCQDNSVKLSVNVAWACHVYGVVPFIEYYIIYVQPMEATMIKAEIQEIDGSLMLPLSSKLLESLEFVVRKGDTLHLIPLNNGDLKIQKPNHKTIRPLVSTADYLDAYSRGQISSGEAIRGMGAEGGFRELLDLMSELEYPLPRGQGKEDIIDKEIENAFPILRKYLKPVGQEFTDVETKLPEID